VAAGDAVDTTNSARLDGGDGSSTAPKSTLALSWRSWPAAERPGQAVAVGLAIVAAALGLGAYGGDPLLAGVIFAVLFLSLSAYFLPTRFRIDEDGVEVTSAVGSRRRRWAALRSYSADARGVTLSPYLRPSWLESYRGLRLLFHRNREEVLAVVGARLEPLAAPRRRR
jgi:hypothetical protein